MRSSESYSQANNFEKSSHLFRCRLSKGTAECWATWAIWLRLSFISGALWTAWHKSCSKLSGKPRAASSGHTRVPQTKVWHSLCPAGWTGDSNEWEAPEIEGEFRWGGCDVLLFYGCTGSWSHREQSQPGDSLGDTESGKLQSSTPQTCKGRACELSLTSPAPLALAECQKILFDLPRAPCPKDKTPVGSLGPKEGQSLVWCKGKSMDWWLLRAEDVQMQNVPPTSLAGSVCAGKCESCVRHLALPRKAQVLSLRALTKPWGGLDGCCQVNSDLAKEAKITANNP